MSKSTNVDVGEDKLDDYIYEMDDLEIKDEEQRKKKEAEKPRQLHFWS